MAVFVDTGAWFAYFVRRDSDHEAAVRWVQQNRQPLLTSDYVLDELLTLLKVRESYRLAIAAGERLWQQRVARVDYLTPGDLTRAWDVFRQYHDKNWSFTDCTSKIIIERLRISEAFAFDSHFEQFGTVIRVP
jgi:uncharacterized protein